MKTLDIKEDDDSLKSSLSEDPVDNALEKYENHPSILTIRQIIINESPNFYFSEVELEEIEIEIKNLNCTKKGPFNNILPKVLKETSDICSPALKKIWNENIVTECVFPNKLKLADVSPVFKKENPLLTKNYRPVSVLPTVSKVFERLMQKQLNEHINQFLSPFLCGYRKGFSSQTALLSLIEKWKIMLDKKGYASAVLMDLSKAFDTINYELLVAKLHAYGFSKAALHLILSYLKDRKQRIKVNTTFSSWTELICGVPKGSVLGPFLFNIYLNDLFFFLQEIQVCNFADDTTLLICNESLEIVLNHLEKNSDLAILWFENNYMKLNTDKCHLLVSGVKYEQIWAQIGIDRIWEEKQVKLLGITIDTELKFETHISNLCNKGNQN